MEKKSRILVTGGNGLVGSALVEALRARGFDHVRGLASKDCDLTDFVATMSTFEKLQPEYVFHTAAHVYGIMGNMKNKGASYLRNTLINTHVVEASRVGRVKKIVALGSGCVYPYPAPGLPLKEDMVWQGPPHHSEDSYAHAKRAMLAQLQAYAEDQPFPYAYVISGNLFGPRDKFDSEFGHVVPSLVRKFYEAKKSGTSVTVWGNGSARRDFMFVNDTSDALIRIMNSVEGSVNMGSGNVHSIREIVDHLTEIAGMQGRVVWDETKPNGQDYRAYDLSKLQGAGFKPQFKLRQGLELTYRWYEQNAHGARH